MRLGIIVRADKTGLGYQTRDYYRNLNPVKTLLVDISILNGNEQHYDWYEDPVVSLGFPNRALIKSFLRGLDVVLTAETPYNFELYSVAREMGVKTVCVENPEFYDHIIYPHLPMPDMIILPSVWKIDEIQSHAESKGTRVVQLHHPVDRKDFPFRLRTGKKPIHIAGKPAANDRNGTEDFLLAQPQGTVITQSNDFAHKLRRQFRHSKIHMGVDDPNFMYQMGDFMVLPRRYGGNCLILNEALSTGMPVLMPNISPNDNILPKEWLVAAFKSDSFEPRTKVDIYSVDIPSLAERIQWLGENIESQSKIADEIADTISWDNLREKYLEVLK